MVPAPVEPAVQAAGPAAVDYTGGILVLVATALVLIVLGVFASRQAGSLGRFASSS